MTRHCLADLRASTRECQGLAVPRAQRRCVHQAPRTQQIREESAGVPRRNATLACATRCMHTMHPRKQGGEGRGRACGGEADRRVSAPNSTAERRQNAASLAHRYGS